MTAPQVFFYLGKWLEDVTGKLYIYIIIIILLTLCVTTLFIVTIGSTSVSDVLIGMPHRGRLNVLVGLLHYSPAALFHKVCCIHALLLGTR